MSDFRSEFDKKLNELMIPSTASTEHKARLIKELDDMVLQNLPSSIYKYRSCNVRNIEALSRNVIYGVPVSLMNDPMDGLVYVDKDKIIGDVKFGISKDFVALVKATKQLPSSMDIYLDDTTKNTILNNILNASEEEVNNIVKQNKKMEEVITASIDAFIDKQIADLREVSLISSFSETPYDPSMWAYYAENHSGFVVEYETKGTRFDYCCNCNLYNPEKCKDRAVRGFLYPMIYKDERCDATMWIDSRLGQFILQELKLTNIKYIPDILFYDRICLTKDTRWEHEKEWRVVCYPEDCKEKGKPVPMSTPTPTAIYYGVNISPESLSLLRGVIRALSANSHVPIKEYQMKIDPAAKDFGLTRELLKE